MISALIGPYLLGQRVEAKLRVAEQIGVVVFVSRARQIVVLAEPMQYDERGFWTHGCRRWALRTEEIERLTVLEGPARLPDDDLDEAPRKKRRPRFDLVRDGKLRAV